MSQSGLIDIEQAHPDIATQFDADSGNAIPIGNVLNIFGGAGIETSGSGNTITVALTGGGAAIDALTTDISGPVLPDGAGNVDVTGTSIFSDGSVANTLTLNVQSTANTLLYGQGTNSNMSEVGPLTDGQLLIGATGSAPVAANLTSADGSISITEGAGSIDLTVAASDDAILTLTGDAGGAVSPSGGNIDVQGVTVANAANAKPTFVQGTSGSSLLEVDVQVAAAITGAPGDKNDAGLSSFDDTYFTVDTDGYTSLTGNAGFFWVEETSTSRSLNVNEGVVGNNASQITMTLPSSATFGDIFCFLQKGSGTIKVAQNAGQTIHSVTTDTTTGTGGFVESIDQWTSFCLVCVTDNTDFALERAPEGNLSFT